MSNIRIIIFLVFILNAFIKCSTESDCQNGVQPSENNECYDRISEDEKEREWHCCFVVKTTTSTPTSSSRECQLLGEDDYNDIDGYIRDELAETGYTFKVECNQSYIILNLLLLLLFLFLCF